MREIKLFGRIYAANYDRSLREWTITFTLDELKDEIAYQRKVKSK